MAGIGSSTSQRLEEETAHLNATDRVAAHRARVAHQREMVQAAHQAASAVDFDLGEDAPQNASARAAQEAKWAAANVDARTHFSVRELLQIQKPAVLKALADYERVTMLCQALGHEPATAGGTDEDASATTHEITKITEPTHQIAKLTPELLELIVDAAMPGQGPLVPAVLSPRLRSLASRPSALSTFRIFVRVRPLLEDEASSGEYAALDANTNALLECHDARLARSGRRLAMVHHWYSADHVFGPRTPEAAVCDGVLEPLLARVLGGAGDSTALLYGQTGAGKTYTMSSLLERVARQLDASPAIANVAAGGGEAATGGGEAAVDGEVVVSGEAAVGRGVEVSFYEVASAGCMDLLNDRAKVPLRSDEHDHVHACGAKTSVVVSGDELRATLAQGLAMRSTVQTQANPISSRSHAICSLTFQASGRTLRIVDLAGSERNCASAPLDPPPCGAPCQYIPAVPALPLLSMLSAHPDASPDRDRAVRRRDALREDSGLPEGECCDQQVAHGAQGLLPGGGACARAPRAPRAGGGRLAVFYGAQAGQGRRGRVCTHAGEPGFC